jgi:hypothetical protein
LAAVWRQGLALLVLVVVQQLALVSALVLAQAQEPAVALAQVSEQ